MSEHDNFKRTFGQIEARTDSREVLAHARRQAEQRKFDDVFIVDIDAHIGDVRAWPEVMDYIEDPVVREAANAFADGSRRGAG